MGDWRQCFLALLILFYSFSRPVAVNQSLSLSVFFYFFKFISENVPLRLEIRIFFLKRPSIRYNGQKCILVSLGYTRKGYNKKGQPRWDLGKYSLRLSKILNLNFLICEKVSLVIIDGAIEHNFPEKYIAKLRGIKHNGILDIPMLKNIEENRKEADEPDKSEPTFRKKCVLIGATILVISLGAFWIKSWLSTHDMSFLCL